MIYYSDGKLTIRTMAEADARAIAAGEQAQGYDTTPDRFLSRLREQAEGRCAAIMAERDGQAAGYIHVYPNAPWGPLGGQGYPEIVDFGVLERFRRQGVGTRLMDAAEAVAAEYAALVYLAVGLHKFYGPAQRLYVRRGYLPDGSGAWYGDKPCEPYETYRNDDELNLYLVKELRKQNA